VRISGPKGTLPNAMVSTIQSSNYDSFSGLLTQIDHVQRLSSRDWDRVWRAGYIRAVHVHKSMKV
jgi:hypothetical protein